MRLRYAKWMPVEFCGASLPSRALVAPVAIESCAGDRFDRRARSASSFSLSYASVIEEE